MSLLDEHAAMIQRVQTSLSRYGKEEQKRLCWAVTPGEYEALEAEMRPRETYPLRDLHILGMRVVPLPDLGEFRLR